MLGLLAGLFTLVDPVCTSQVLQLDPNSVFQRQMELCTPMAMVRVMSQKAAQAGVPTRSEACV